MSRETNNLFEGQGEVFIGPVTDGEIGVFHFLGEATAYVIEQSEDVEVIKESQSGLKNQIKRIGKGITKKLKITFRDIKRKNLMLAFRGTEISISSGSVSNETLNNGDNVAVGDYVRLENTNVSSLVITDSAVSPATLTLNTHYEIVDADFGMIKIKALTGTQPYKAAYTKGATKGVAADTTEGTNYFVRLHGLNVSDRPFKKVLNEVYKVAFGPAASFALLQEEVASFDLEGELLLDDTRADNSDYGGYFRTLNVDDLS